ncbi:MAG: hypothetical protein IKX88_08510, partial [Thermoguttaceae bacterium]|nr:hypothetical protein [Thermoguttaceae bacterium]
NVGAAILVGAIGVDQNISPMGQGIVGAATERVEIREFKRDPNREVGRPYAGRREWGFRRLADRRRGPLGVVSTLALRRTTLVVERRLQFCGLENKI